MVSQRKTFLALMSLAEKTGQSVHHSWFYDGETKSYMSSRYEEIEGNGTGFYKLSVVGQRVVKENPVSFTEVSMKEWMLENSMLRYWKGPKVWKKRLGETWHNPITNFELIDVHKKYPAVAKLAMQLMENATERTYESPLMTAFKQCIADLFYNMTLRGDWSMKFMPQYLEKLIEKEFTVKEETC